METISTVQLVQVLIAVLTAALTTAGMFWAVVRFIIERIERGDEHSHHRIDNLERRSINRQEFEQLKSEQSQIRTQQERHAGEINGRLDGLFAILLTKNFDSNKGSAHGSTND